MPHADYNKLCAVFWLSPQRTFTEYNRKCNISTLSRVVGQYFKSKMKLHLSTVPVHLRKDNKLSKNTYKEENPDVSKVIHHT